MLRASRILYKRVMALVSLSLLFPWDFCSLFEVALVLQMAIGVYEHSNLPAIRIAVLSKLCKADCICFQKFELSRHKHMSQETILTTPSQSLVSIWAPPTPVWV